MPLPTTWRYTRLACTSRIEASDGAAQAARSSGRSGRGTPWKGAPARRDDLEAGGGQELPQRTGGVQPQMAHDLGSRAAVDAAQADLREHGLHPGEQQHRGCTRRPGSGWRASDGRPGRRMRRSSSRARPGSTRCSMTSLKSTASADRVGQRQPARRSVHPARHTVIRVRGAAQRVLGPVDADDPVAGEERRRGGGRGAVAAADVEDDGPGSAGPAPGPASRAWRRLRWVAGGDGDGRVLVEVAQSRRESVRSWPVTSVNRPRRSVMAAQIVLEEVAQVGCPPRRRAGRGTSAAPGAAGPPWRRW